MAESYHATKARAETDLLFAVDPDDVHLEAYRKAVQCLVLPERHGYTSALNTVASAIWEDDSVILGAFGDDVLFRTTGWDDRVEEALATPGIAYGDDLIHGEKHPTAVWMSAPIARALGWLAMPFTSHQWADDAWKLIGQRSGLMRFLPDVIVEHMHPGVGKAEWDDTYLGVFESARAASDFAGFEAWRDTYLSEDLNRISFALDAIEAGKSRRE
jgi:hypothetical protein